MKLRSNVTRNVAMRVMMILLVPVLMLSLTGCPKGTIALAEASDSIAHSLNAANDAIDLAEKSNQVSSQESDTFKQYLGKSAQAGLILDQAIRANESKASVNAKADAFINAFHLMVDSGLTGIKNSNVKLSLGTVLNGAQVALAVIAADLGSK